MWIKLILCILIVVFCVVLGYFSAEKYRSRKLFFNEFSNFNDRYLNELSYSKKPLEQFLSEYEYRGDFKKVIEKLRKRTQLGIDFSYLTKEEISDCSDYFAMLGRGDSRSQTEFFITRRAQLSDKKDKTEKEAKRRSELYLKLGLLFGLALVILLI